MCSSSSIRTVYYINSLLRSNPRYYNRNSYVACFTSTSHKIQGGIINTPGNTREGDRRVAGRDVVYDTSAGMPNVDSKARWGEEEEEEEEGYSRQSTAKDTAKAGVAAAVETGLKVGEMTKQTVDGVWDAARKTAESVRDSVVADDDGNQRPAQRSNKGYASEEHADKHVEDLRRRAGGYDLNNNNP